MRYFIVALTLLVSSPALAQNFNCGMKPFPAPIGCKPENARCVCDQNGNCQWVWDCGR